MIEETEAQNEPQWLEPSSIGVYQAEFGVFVKSQGFGWIVCYSWEEAAEVLTQYLTYGVE